MKATKPESTYEPVPKGNHVARMYQIVHIGTSSYEWMGEIKKSDKVRLTFELCNERKVFKEGEEPKPFSISREFGLYMGKNSKLRPFVEGLIGTSLMDDEAYNFDLEDMIGEPCLLNVVHVEKGDKVYANISNASPLPKGMDAPEMFNPKSVIDVNTSSEEEIAALPEFLRNKIYATDEWAARQKHASNIEDINTGKLKRPKSLGGDDVVPEDVPF